MQRIKSANMGSVFCLLLGVSSDYAQPITGQVTEVICPVIGRAQPEPSPSKRQKMGPGHLGVETCQTWNTHPHCSQKGMGGN